MERRLRELLPPTGFGGTPAARSKTMRAIRRCGNATTERRLRAGLIQAGLKGWVVNPRTVPGRPDFFFRAVGLVVFVDGCFWHHCPICSHLPKTNAGFWVTKLSRNVERDRQTTDKLIKSGLTVVRFWEHELRSDLRACVGAIDEILRFGAARASTNRDPQS
jgi:DNA mismatch endonuclease (patch repair protein)